MPPLLHVTIYVIILFFTYLTKLSWRRPLPRLCRRRLEFASRIRLRIDISRASKYNLKLAIATDKGTAERRWSVEKNIDGHRKHETVVEVKVLMKYRWSGPLESQVVSHDIINCTRSWLAVVASLSMSSRYPFSKHLQQAFSVYCCYSDLFELVDLSSHTMITQRHRLMLLQLIWPCLRYPIPLLA